MEYVENTTSILKNIVIYTFLANSLWFLPRRFSFLRWLHNIGRARRCYVVRKFWMLIGSYLFTKSWGVCPVAKFKVPIILLRNFTVTSSEKIFREIKFIVVYYVTIKTLLSRNFCQKSVRKNFLLIVTSSTILSQKFSQSNIFIKELFSSWFDKKYFALQQ